MKQLRLHGMHQGLRHQSLAPDSIGYTNDELVAYLVCSRNGTIGTTARSNALPGRPSSGTRAVIEAIDYSFLNEISIGTRLQRFASCEFIGRKGRTCSLPEVPAYRQKLSGLRHWAPGLFHGRARSCTSTRPSSLPCSRPPRPMAHT